MIRDLHSSNFYTLPFYYCGHAISKTVFQSSLALLLPVLVNFAPLLMKNIKKFPKVVFDISKEASCCTEYNAQILSSFQSTVSEKIKKNLIKIPIFNQNGQKMVNLGGVFLIFSENIPYKNLGFFCVAFSALGPFFLIG